MNSFVVMGQWLTGEIVFVILKVLSLFLNLISGTLIPIFAKMSESLILLKTLNINNTSELFLLFCSELILNYNSCVV